MRSVDSFLNSGIFTPIGKYELGEKDNKTEIAIGTLVGFNDEGKLVSAEGTFGNDNNYVLPVGIITEGSTVTIEDPRYIPNGKSYKEVGDYQELYMKFKMINVEDVWVSGDARAKVHAWKYSDIGRPVYLNRGALVVDEAKLTANSKYVKIGTLGDPARKEIICLLMNEVETKANVVKATKEVKNKEGGE